jgi:hypothetical protein
MFSQHAHIENIKTVANLTNNMNVFMCILRFHARAGYLQTYETLLKEINMHPGSASVPVADDQYLVECVALSNRNINLACETGIRDPSLVAMLNRRSMMWRMSVMFYDELVYTRMYSEQTSTYQYVLGMYSDSFVMNRLLREIARVCMLGHQPSEAKQARVCSRTCPPIGHVRCTGIPSKMTGVHIQDGTSGPSLVAYQAG